MAPAFGTLILLAAAALGAGAAVLAVTRVLPRLDRLEAFAWAYAIGFGALGWLVFFFALAGALERGWLLALALVLAGGTVLLRRAARGPAADAGGGAWWLLVAALAATMLVDLLEGLAPPADADSLAYHFALPKQFIAAGRLAFVPRAVDGAAPLLPQMTHMAALALGGEQAMTLWTMLSGWMLGLLVYAIARRHLDAPWALAAAVLTVGTPAVLFGAGTGQVETRLALFATVSAFALARGIAERHLGYVLAAGLAAGFFAASKYTGLLYVAAAGLVLAGRWPALRALVGFAGAALLAGVQWYAWNAWHTGDPVFPALHALLGLPDGPFWNAAQDAIFRSIYRSAENPLPIDLWNALAYPFVITFAPPTAIDSGRTGLGPYGILVLPFALAGLWRYRRSLAGSPLVSVALVAVAFYALWFASGMSQRVRHLLPVWPLFVIAATVAAVRWSEGGAQRRALATAAAVAVALHLGAQGVFGLSYARHVLGGESRAAFLARSVPLADTVAPVEAAMGPGDRVLVDQRQLIYLFDVPTFYYHFLDQAQVRLGGEADPATAWRQMTGLGITHLLASVPASGADPTNSTYHTAAALEGRGCLRRVAALEGRSFMSRTLGGEALSVPFALFARTGRPCDPSG